MIVVPTWGLRVEEKALRQSGGYLCLVLDDTPETFIPNNVFVFLQTISLHYHFSELIFFCCQFSIQNLKYRYQRDPTPNEFSGLKEGQGAAHSGSRGAVHTAQTSRGGTVGP